MLAVRSSLYIDVAVIIVVFVLVLIPWKKKTTILWGLMISYLIVYSFLVFSRKPSATATAILTPFWSYREAFGAGGIKRLGLAREILMNILVYVPLGLILGSMMERSRHPVAYPVLIGLGLSILTEVIQYFGHLGLMELDDVINNTAGALIGVVGYRIGKKVLGKP